MISVNNKVQWGTFEKLDENIIKASHESSKSELGESDSGPSVEDNATSNILTINGTPIILGQPTPTNYKNNRQSHLLVSGEENFGHAGDEFNKEEKKIYNALEGAQKFSDAYSSKSIIGVYDNRKFKEIKHYYDNYVEDQKNKLSCLL